MISVLTIVIVYGLVNNHYYMKYEDTTYQLQLDNQRYDLRNPKQRWDLPHDLEEISGLSYYDKNKLACVQDEEGFFYIYDLKKEEIVREEKFGEKGDYEGVETISDTVYVLKSNGNMYYFQLKKKGIGEVNTIKTDLSKRNDAEGLGYHALSNEILIACKEEPGTKKVELEKSRAVYRISLPGKKFMKKPKIVIEGKSYNNMLEKKELSKKKHKPFKPSAIAVHPKTQYIFIIGTVGKMMIILNPEGKLYNLIPLDPKIFWQPEGLCFSPDGDLFISSEGRGKKGYILKF